MSNTPFAFIDLAQHDDWFKDGAEGRKQFEAVFAEVFKEGGDTVPVVHEGKTIALALSPELSRKMMIDHLMERIRGDDRLLLKVLKIVEHE